MTYNGWKNYETWNVALWIGSDEGLYNAVRHGGPKWTANAIASFMREIMPNGTPDFDGDATRYDAVDWHAVAECINEA